MLKVVAKKTVYIWCTNRLDVLFRRCYKKPHYFKDVKCTVNAEIEEACINDRIDLSKKVMI